MISTETIGKRFEDLLGHMDASNTQAVLKEHMLAKGFTIRGAAFPTLLRPYFIDRAELPDFRHVTHHLLRSLNKISDAYFREGLFQKQIRLSGRAAELASIPAGYPGHHVVTRLDFFFTPETHTLKLLEFNCGDPSGMGRHDMLVAIFQSLPVLQELNKEFSLSVDWLIPSHHKHLLQKYRQWCDNQGRSPRQPPNVVFTCSRNSPIVNDFRPFVEYYNEHGTPTAFVDLLGFEYDGKTLTQSGIAVDIIYRDAIEEFMANSYWQGVQPIIQAYRDGNVCLANPFSANSGDFKSILEILTDPQFESLFTPAEREVHARVVPWTRTVEPGKTSYHGKTIDLVEYIRAHKDHFVLKPNDGYSGHGVLIGFATSQQVWESTLDACLQHSGVNDGSDPHGAGALNTHRLYTVQELVDIPTLNVPVFADGRLNGFAPKHVNLNVWAHDGEYVGVHARAADGYVININQGGGMLPCMYVD